MYVESFRNYKYAIQNASNFHFWIQIRILRWGKKKKKQSTAFQSSDHKFKTWGPFLSLTSPFPSPSSSIPNLFCVYVVCRFGGETLSILESLLVSRDVKSLVETRSYLREFLRSESVSALRSIAGWPLVDKLSALDFFVSSFALLGDAEVLSRSLSIICQLDVFLFLYVVSAYVWHQLDHHLDFWICIEFRVTSIVCIFQWNPTIGLLLYYYAEN